MLSGWTRTVEIDEQAAVDRTARSSTRVAAMREHRNTTALCIDDSIVAVARRLASLVLAAIVAGPFAARADQGPEEALDKKIAVWRFDALGIDTRSSSGSRRCSASSSI